MLAGELGRFIATSVPEFSLIEGTAILFGLIWATVNFYHVYPFFQLFLDAKLSRENSTVYTEIEDESIENQLPTIDVLIPAYREGDVIHQSIRSIRNANYPQTLVNVHLLVEPDDTDTQRALDELSKEYEFQEIRIPTDYQSIIVPEKYPGLPNKPRALNYGFELTEGELVGVIDAEDIVDPNLFSKVSGALIGCGKDFVQGKLDMVNEDDGWKNTLFRGEYGWWFGILLPAFYHVGYPVPLGGTTNFFHRSVLEEISTKRYQQYGNPWNEKQRAWFGENNLDGAVPWDPRNVTEDFELGIFLWKEGYELGLIETVTREESPLTVDAWVRQRTRWQKGKVYTFLQYLRHPPRGLRAKFHGFFQSLLPHLAPVNIAGIVILAMFANLAQEGLHPAIWIVLSLGLVFVLESMLLQLYGYWIVSTESRFTRVRRAVLNFATVPFYWLLLWGAELRALKQIYLKQNHWEKTTHHGRNGEKEGP